jgi:hypothetical protein
VNWIEDVLRDHQDVETPLSYMYWSMMACISAVAANGYTLRTLKGNLLYYPNIYIILMGESGLGKGFPINLAKKLVMEAKATRVIAGRSSIQAIVKELATTRSENGKPVMTDSRGFIVNGELSTAVIQDPNALTILTDLYDSAYNKEWVNMLKGDGGTYEKLKFPYITCLFGSSPSHFYDSIPQPNIEGGYIGRNLLIYEEQRAKNLDLLDSEKESINDDKFIQSIIPKFIPHLQKIASNKARLIPTDGARSMFNSWRKQWRENQKNYTDKTGFVNRVPDHTLKVAMCLALARYENGEVIEEGDVNEAIQNVSSLVYANEKIVAGSGVDPLSSVTRKVVEYLMAAPDNQLLRRDLLVRCFGDCDDVALDRIIDTLVEMRWIRKQRVGVGANSDYLIFLHGEPLRKLKQFREERK